MRERSNDELLEFERRLKEFVKREKFVYPLSDEIIEEILNALEPAEVSEAFSERLLSTMKRASEMRKRMEEKLSNIYKVNSFGEYLHLFRLRSGLSVEDLADSLSTEPSLIEKLENDLLVPMNSFVLQIAKVIKSFLKLSFENALFLLEKTFLLQPMKKDTALDSMYARSDTKMDELSRAEALQDADNKLLLSLEEDSHSQETNYKWQEFAKEFKKVVSEVG